jgi:hypothetical protein
MTHAGAGSCKKRTSHCVHSRVVGTLTYAGEPAGNDAVTFRGKVGKQTVRPGHYLAIFTARNGIERSKAVRLPLVIEQ